MSEDETQQAAPIAGIGTMVFGKWDAQEVVCGDPGLAPYINLTTIGTPHSGGRHANAWFGKSKLSVIERFINNLMRTGKFSYFMVFLLDHNLNDLYIPTGRLYTTTIIN